MEGVKRRARLADSLFKMAAINLFKNAESEEHAFVQQQSTRKVHQAVLRERIPAHTFPVLKAMYSTNRSTGCTITFVLFITLLLQRSIFKKATLWGEDCTSTKPNQTCRIYLPSKLRSWNVVSRSSKASSISTRYMRVKRPQNHIVWASKQRIYNFWVWQKKNRSFTSKTDRETTFLW